MGEVGIGSPAEWAQFGALGLVVLALLILLVLFAKYFFSYIDRKESQTIEEIKRRDELTDRWISGLISTHEKTSAAIAQTHKDGISAVLAAVDRLQDRMVSQIGLHTK